MGLVTDNWLAVLLGERRNHFAFFVEDLGPQLPFRTVEVHKEMAPLEAERTGGQGAASLPGVHRGKAIAAEDRQTCGGVLVPAFGFLRLGVVHSQTRLGTAGEVEIEFVAHDETARGYRLHISVTPVFLVPGRGDEVAPVRAVPVKSIATETEQDVVALLKTLLPAFVVAGARPDGEGTDHETLVGCGVEIVELGFASEFLDWIPWIDHLAGDPVDALLRVPEHAFVYELLRVGVLAVAACTTTPGNPFAEHPDLAERIVEDGTPVAVDPLLGQCIGPVDAVWAGAIYHRPAVGMTALRAEILEPLGWIPSVVVEPYRGGVHAPRGLWVDRADHDIGIVLNVECRLVPGDTVLARG